MRILAVIVAYNPDLEALERCLASFQEHVDKVVIWKNSNFDYERDDVEFAGDDSNCGIGKALNYAWKKADEEGFDALLTMDQDSVWQDFPAFLQKAAQAPDGLWGPWVNKEPAADFVASDLLITSGMLVPLRLIKRIGGWREDFLVDAVDVDFVLHAKELGIPAWRVGGGWLQQQFGGRRKKGLIHVYDYSPERLYGIFRNHIIVIRRYKGVSGQLRRMFVKRWYFSRPIRILLGEKDAFKKLGAIIRGIRDGKRYHGKRVSVVTWFTTPNYGTDLQAYATVFGLKQAGAEPVLLHRFEEPVSFGAVRENFNRKFGIRRFWKYAPDPWPQKTRSIKAFCRANIPSKHIVTPGDLRRLKARTDLFLCGGDQLWNPIDHFRPFELLGFVHGVRKAAFATSMGVGRIPANLAPAMKAALSEFGPIAMRERAGVEAISELTGRADIRQVSDPVFLLTADDWRRIAVKADAGEPYLLAYVLRQGQESMVNAIARAAGLNRILSIPAGENPRPQVGEVRGNVGLQEFLGLIDGAALVVTDSFHGLALSALLSREMLLLRRFSDDDPASQNGRLYELAAQLGLDDRFFSGFIPPVADWPSVQERIDTMRSEAYTILKDTLQ